MKIEIELFEGDFKYKGFLITRPDDGIFDYYVDGINLRSVRLETIISAIDDYVLSKEYIKLNAPEGSTHYRVLKGKVEYIKKLSYHDTWYLWLEYMNDWMITFWKRADESHEIKNL